jgi:hypothetical protein
MVCLQGNRVPPPRRGRDYEDPDINAAQLDQDTMSAKKAPGDAGPRHGVSPGEPMVDLAPILVQWQGLTLPRPFLSMHYTADQVNALTNAAGGHIGACMDVQG